MWPLSTTQSTNSKSDTHLHIHVKASTTATVTQDDLSAHSQSTRAKHRVSDASDGFSILSFSTDRDRSISVSSPHNPVACGLRLKSGMNDVQPAETIKQDEQNDVEDHAVMRGSWMELTPRKGGPRFEEENGKPSYVGSFQHYGDHHKVQDVMNKKDVDVDVDEMCQGEGLDLSVTDVIVDGKMYCGKCSKRRQNDGGWFQPLRLL